MAQYIAILVTFVIALLASLYKCVEEDSQGKRIYSPRGIPKLTKPGKWIAGFLALSFMVSLWTTAQSSRASDETKKKLRETSQQLQKVEDQLGRAREENIEGYRSVLREQQTAQAQNLRESKSILEKQELTAKRISKNLEASAQSTQRNVVRHLSEVREFSMDFFLAGYGENLDSFLEQDHLRSIKEPDADFYVLLKAVFCSFPKIVSNVVLSVSLATEQRLDFDIRADVSEKGDCKVKKELVAQRLTEIPRPERTQRELRQNPMELNYVWRKKRRAWVTIHVVEEDLQSLRLSPPLRVVSLNPAKYAVFSAKVSNQRDVPAVAEHLKRILPRYIGFNIAPNRADLESEAATAWIFYLNSEPRVTSEPELPGLIMDKVDFYVKFYFELAQDRTRWDWYDFTGFSKAKSRKSKQALRPKR